jgi:hypothetical protein
LNRRMEWVGNNTIWSQISVQFIRRPLWQTQGRNQNKWWARLHTIDCCEQSHLTPKTEPPKQTLQNTSNGPMLRNQFHMSPSVKSSRCKIGAWNECKNVMWWQWPVHKSYLSWGHYERCKFDLATRWSGQTTSPRLAKRNAVQPNLGVRKWIIHNHLFWQ